MRKTLTGVIMVFVIGIAIFLQANLLQVIPLDGTSANIGIILVASVGLICGKYIGGVTGIVYGILYDIYTMVENLLGWYRQNALFKSKQYNYEDFIASNVRLIIYMS